MQNKTIETALVTAVHKERYEIETQTGPGFARLKAGVYYPPEGEAPAWPTVGDRVCIEPNPSGDAVITDTLPRHSYFERQAADFGRGKQAVAANFDLVVILQALGRDFNLRRLERYLAQAQASGAPAIVVLTKADLAPDAAEKQAAAQAVAGTVPVYVVSAHTGQGLAQLTPHLAAGSTLVFLGSSGVGKSSLVNALAGEELMATGAVRADDERARHTTTHRQLLKLPGGVCIIDTPGMRMLGMWDSADGVESTFADVQQYLGCCRFSDCRHENEPGCAIRAAIEAGELDAARWKNWQTLQREALWSEDRDAAMRQKRDRNKAVAHKNRLLDKADYRHKKR